MNDLPSSIRPVLRRLRWRIAVGQFLDIWPAWAVANFLLAGLVTLVCRLSFPSFAPILPWIWFLPAVSVLAALFVRFRRAHMILPMARAKAKARNRMESK